MVSLLGGPFGLAQVTHYVPQVADGGTSSGFLTSLNIVNLSDTQTVEVTIELTADDGGTFPRLPPSAPGNGARSLMSFSLAPLGFRRVNTTIGPFAVVGWAKIYRLWRDRCHNEILLPFFVIPPRDYDNQCSVGVRNPSVLYRGIHQPKRPMWHGLTQPFRSGDRNDRRSTVQGRRNLSGQTYRGTGTAAENRSIPER